MARQVLPIAGAIVGGVIGGPMGAQAGFAVGSLIGNAVDPLEVQGNKIGDSPLQTASEGGARAIVFGKGCIRSTCILERGNRIVRKQRDQAGKGGGPVTISWRVFWTFAIGLGEDLVGGAILRIWEGEKLVYDVTPGSTIPAESAEFAAKFRFYDGAEDQLPDPDLESIHGVGNAPYYRGTAYVVFPNFDLTDYREAIPTYRWEVSRTPITHMREVLDWQNEQEGRTWTPPEGVTHVDVLVVGAGGCGESDRTLGLTSSNASGGGGGGQVRWEMSVPVEGAVSVHVGGGGSITDLAGEFSSFGEIVALGGSRAFSTSGYNGSGGDAGSVVGSEPGNGGSGGYAGGASSFVPGRGAGGGGAGAGGAGNPGSTAGAGTGGGGGSGRDLSAIFPDLGDEGWFGGGGGGALAYTDLANYDQSNGGTGGGGQGGSRGGSPIGDEGLPTPGLNGTGGGGGGGIASSDVYANNGGHGLIVVRWINPAIGDLRLSEIVAALHARCGHSADDFDVSELTDLVAGVVFEQSVTGAEAINSVIGGYFADPSAYDSQIHYIKRGKAVVRTLTYDDLIDEPETTRRENAIEYPRKLHLFAQTSWTAYAATKSTSSRSSPDLNAVVGEVSVAIPVTFDGPDEPAQIAAKLHKVNWTDAEGEIVWQVTDEHADLVPTDCIGLSLRGRLTRARITGIEDSPGVRKLTMRVDRQSAYTSDVTGIPLPAPTPPQPSILSPTVNAYLDIPALRDSDDGAAPVYYDAMSGQTDVWPGAVLQRSLDGGGVWAIATASVGSLNAIMGVLQNTVADASPYYTDNGNEVVVQLYMDNQIDSLTNQQFLSEQGAFALSWMDGDVRRWEVMQYRDAEEIADKTYRLTTLHRGRLNTAPAEHLPGSLFVMLDGAVRVVDAQSAWIGTDLTHRAVTNGLSPETAVAMTEPYTAQSQTEWPVAHVLLDHDGDDLHVEIVPRHRFGTALNPIRSINWTGYRLTATDGTNTAALDTSSDTHTFDVTGWASPITVTVAQLNRITGAGPTVTEATA